MRKTNRIQLLVSLTKTVKMLTKKHIQLFPSTKYVQSCRLMSTTLGKLFYSVIDLLKIEQVKKGSCIAPTSATAYSNQLNLHT